MQDQIKNNWLKYLALPAMLFARRIWSSWRRLFAAFSLIFHPQSAFQSFFSVLSSFIRGWAARPNKSIRTCPCATPRFSPVSTLIFMECTEMLPADLWGCCGFFYIRVRKFTEGWYVDVRCTCVCVLRVGKYPSRSTRPILTQKRRWK